MTAHQSYLAMSPDWPLGIRPIEEDERSTGVSPLFTDPGRAPHYRALRCRRIRSRGSRAPLGHYRRVRVLNGPLEGRTYSTHDGLAFGRDANAGVRLFGDEISWRHARLRRLPNGRDQLEDLASTNGTIVEGLRVRRQQLAPGMVFIIGDTYFVYEDQAADEYDTQIDGQVQEVERRSTDRLPSSGPWWQYTHARARRDPDAPRPRRSRLTDIVTTSYGAVDFHPTAATA